MLCRAAFRGENSPAASHPPAQKDKGDTSAGSTFSGTELHPHPGMLHNRHLVQEHMQVTNGLLRGLKSGQRSSAMSWLWSGSLRQKADIVPVSKHNSAFHLLEPCIT